MNGKQIKKTGRLTLAGVLALTLSACGLSPESNRAAIEKGILETPGAEELWQTVKQEYPEDFGALLDQLQELDLAERLDEGKVEEIGAAWLQSFFTEIAPNAVKAPAEQMIAWSTAEKELYATLQRSDIEKCAAITMGQWIFIEDENAVGKAAVSRRNAAMVRASAAGRDDPQDYAEPGDAAFVQLGDAIAATGLAPELQASLGSDEALAGLSKEQQCEVGVAVYAGLSAMPDDAEPEMAAYMLSPEE